MFVLLVDAVMTAIINNIRPLLLIQSGIINEHYNEYFSCVFSLLYAAIAYVVFKMLCYRIKKKHSYLIL